MITTRAPDGANKFVLHWVKSTWYSVIEELRMTDSRIFFSNLGWILHPRESEDLIMKVAATWLPAWLARWPGDPQIMDAPDSAQYHTPASGASDKFFFRFFCILSLGCEWKGFREYLTSLTTSIPSPPNTISPSRRFTRLRRVQKLSADFCWKDQKFLWGWVEDNKRADR